jgi:hypothetical protein
MGYQNGFVYQKSRHLIMNWTLTNNTFVKKAVKKMGKERAIE